MQHPSERQTDMLLNGMAWFLTDLFLEVYSVPHKAITACDGAFHFSSRIGRGNKMSRFVFFLGPDWLILDTRLLRAKLSRLESNTSGPSVQQLSKLAISTAAYGSDDLSPWFGLRVEPMVGLCL